MSNLESYFSVLLLIGLFSLGITVLFVLSDMDNYNTLENKLSKKQARYIANWIFFILLPLLLFAVIPLVFMGLSWGFYRIVDFILANKEFVASMILVPGAIFIAIWRVWLRSKKS